MTAQIEAREETAAEFRRLADAWRETRDSLSSRVNDLIENWEMIIPSPVLGIAVTTASLGLPG